MRDEVFERRVLQTPTSPMSFSRIKTDAVVLSDTCSYIDRGWGRSTALDLETTPSRGESEILSSFPPRPRRWRGLAFDS